MIDASTELLAGEVMLVVPIGQIATEVGGLEVEPDGLTGVEVVCARVGNRPTLVQIRLAIAGGEQIVAILTSEEAEELADLLIEAAEVEVVPPAKQVLN